MKNNIKKYLTLGAALAGSAFLVSCDGGSSGGSTTTTTTTPVVDPADPSATDTINNDTSFNVLSTGANALTLTFNDDPSNNLNIVNAGPFGTTGTFASVAPGDIMAGQTFLLNPPYTATSVSASSKVITVGLLSDDVGVVPNSSDISDLVLTETSFVVTGTRQDSEGTFTCNFVIAEVASIPALNLTPAVTTILGNGAAPVGGAFPFVNVESTSGNQPTIASVATPTSVFTVAVGDILFVDSGKLYITDNTTASATIVITSATPTHDIATARDAAPGEVICLTQDGAAAISVPQTGTYKMTIN